VIRLDEFVKITIHSQDPLYSLQRRAIYSFPLGIWASLDATYFTGRRSTLNGQRNDDLQRNWRVGGTLAFPMNVHNSIKFYASSGVSSRTGNDYDLIGIGWQYRWGGRTLEVVLKACTHVQEKFVQSVIFWISPVAGILKLLTKTTDLAIKIY
jgi:hypothetical protein